MWSDKYLMQYLKKTMLKLSSPLRTDQNGDDNKENILAGQDTTKVKPEEKAPCISALILTNKSAPIQAAETNGAVCNLNQVWEGDPLSSPNTSRNSSPSFDVENSANPTQVCDNLSSNINHLTEIQESSAPVSSAIINVKSVDEFEVNNFSSPVNGQSEPETVLNLTLITEYFDCEANEISVPGSVQRKNLPEPEVCFYSPCVFNDNYKSVDNSLKLEEDSRNKPLNYETVLSEGKKLIDLLDTVTDKNIDEVQLTEPEHNSDHTSSKDRLNETVTIVPVPGNQELDIQLEVNPESEQNIDGKVLEFETDELLIDHKDNTFDVENTEENSDTRKEIRDLDATIIVNPLSEDTFDNSHTLVEDNDLPSVQLQDELQTIPSNESTVQCKDEKLLNTSYICKSEDNIQITPKIEHTEAYNPSKLTVKTAENSLTDQINCAPPNNNFCLLENTHSPKTENSEGSNLSKLTAKTAEGRLNDQISCALPNNTCHSTDAPVINNNIDRVQENLNSSKTGTSEASNLSEFTVKAAEESSKDQISCELQINNGFHAVDDSVINSNTDRVPENCNPPKTETSNPNPSKLDLETAADTLKNKISCGLPTYNDIHNATVNESNIERVLENSSYSCNSSVVLDNLPEIPHTSVELISSGQNLDSGVIKEVYAEVNNCSQEALIVDNKCELEENCKKLQADTIVESNSIVLSVSAQEQSKIHNNSSQDIDDTKENKVAPEKVSITPEIVSTSITADGKSSDSVIEKISTLALNEDPIHSEDAINQTLNTRKSNQLHSEKMGEMTEEMYGKMQQAISDLKLELNASQQAKASLELEIGKKDEIILKTQAEGMRKEQDIKSLKEQLKEKSSVNEKDCVKDLEEALKEAKTKESQALSELNARINDGINYQEILEGYEKTLSTFFANSQRLKEEQETVTRHLANLELSFSDLHQKYERAKTIIEGFRTNEDKLRVQLGMYEDTHHKQEERYESLKAHAKAQIENANKVNIQLKEKCDSEVTKLNAIIKRLEIKSAALEISLEQKTNECTALAALCDEVTGKKV